MLDYLVSHSHVILLIVVLINQILSDIPAFKGNTIFTLYRGLVKQQALKSNPELVTVLSAEAK
jgi:hypothetical protein